MTVCDKGSVEVVAFREKVPDSLYFFPVSFVSELGGTPLDPLE